MKRSPTPGPGPEFWREVDFPQIHDEPAGLRAYIERLRAEYQNGDVIHRAFLFPEPAELRQRALDAFARDHAFFHCFWHCRSVRAALPYALHDEEFSAGRPFEPMTSVELPGQLAAVLARGGAYSRDQPKAREAMALGMDAAEALVAGEFDGVRVLRSHAPWSRFFQDVAWDDTWIVVQLERGRIDVLMATDTD